MQTKGKQAFGTQEWRAICTKVREGEVWEEVVRHGYHGVEGDVDAMLLSTCMDPPLSVSRGYELTRNRATLLLAHARVQTVNQSGLRITWLLRTPNLDISDRFSESSPRRFDPRPRRSGADTPRDLNARDLDPGALHFTCPGSE